LAVLIPVFAGEGYRAFAIDHARNLRCVRPA